MTVELSVVIPAHNEAENVVDLCDRCRRALDPLGRPYEIIFIDDNSTDNTRAVLEDLARRLPAVRVILHHNNCGQSTSVVSGVRAAAGRVIATLDGDGQNDPADIPAMPACLEQNAAAGIQMVAGYRKKRRDSFVKRIFSRIANRVRRMMLRDNTPDTGCGLKVFYRDAFLRLPCFDHMHRFLPALVRRQGGGVISHEVQHHPRTRGRSHYGTLGRLRVGIVDLFGVWWLCRRAQVPQSTEYRPEVKP
ncbi:MAG: glycosyltransferase family 2 protein [Planctomycetota bacterium]